MNIKHLYQRRLLMLTRHLQMSCDPLVKECFSIIFQKSCDPLVKECFSIISQMPSSKSLLSKAEIVAVDLGLDNFSCLPTGQLKSIICSAQQQKLVTRLCEKPLHDKFYTYMRSDINTSHSFQWLKHCGL